MTSRFLINMERPLDADDVLYSGSDDGYYESSKERQRRYDLQAQRYMDGKPVAILSAHLRGPFDRESGWLNPWRSRRQAEKETRTRPATIRHPRPRTISSIQPNRECTVVPETIIKPKVPTLLQNTSSSNISLGPSSRRRETESSSFQLPSPVCTASQPRPINPWMDDEAWGRVQAWREAVKPDYGSGEELHIEDKSLFSPLPGRKRPAAAEFLRKALASSKRLKASELKYSTPATPSPVKRSLPIQQPDSSGTFGPVLSSSQDSNGARRGSSSFRSEVVNIPAVQEAPTMREPLVDYASSYNTVPGQSPTLVLPHRTPTELATPGLRQIGMQGEPTSPIRESSQPQSQTSFEQRLLSSRKVRASTTFRRSSTAPVESRQGTPLRSPPAHLTSGEPATPKYASQSSLPTSAVRLVGTTIKPLEEQELEFESQADRSFQFRVKVLRNGGKRDVPKRSTERSRLNRVSRASTDDLVPKFLIPGPVRAGQESGEAPVSRDDGDETDHVSEDETASEGSLVHERGLPEPEFPALTVPETGDVENDTVLVAVEPILASEDSSKQKPVNVDVVDVEISNILKEKSLDEDLMEDAGTTVSIIAGPSRDRSSSVPEAESEAPHEAVATFDQGVHSADEDEPMGKLPAPSARILHQSTPLKVTPSNPASSPYVADLGGHHMLPALAALALSFSPLSSFFGTRGDDDPVTKAQGAEKATEEATEEVPDEGPENACEVRARSSPPASTVPVEPHDAHATSSNGLSPVPVGSHPALILPQPSSPVDSELQHIGQETSDRETRPAEGPDRARNDASDMQTATRVESSQHSSSPRPAAETETSILESPHHQSPWTRDTVTAVQPTTAVEGELIEPEGEPQYNSTPANIDSPLCSPAHHHTHTPLDEPDPSVGTGVPSVQSPWVDTALTPMLPTARLVDDVRFSSRQCPFSLIQPVQGSESQSQNPWRQGVNTTPAKMLVSSRTANQGISVTSPLEHQNHISHAHPHSFNRLSSPASAHGSTISVAKQLNADEDLSMPDTTSPSTQRRPSTPSRPQSSLPTPDFTLSVKSFREFATPSPARRRMRPSGGHRTKSILKPTRIRYSDIGFPSRMTTKPSPKAKRVSFALELARNPSSSSFADESTTLGAELATMEATRTPPRRNAERSFSPPLQLSQSELPGSTDRFYSHFAKMVRKGPQMRRKSRSPTKTGRSKLLPSASQQILGSPGFVDMAEAFIAADSMKLDPEDDDDVDMDRSVGQAEEDHEVDMGRPEEPEEPEQEEYEDQYETDPVAHVLGNLDAFIGAFDVDLELSKARLVEDNAQESQGRQVYFPEIASQDLDREVTGRGVWS